MPNPEAFLHPQHFSIQPETRRQLHSGRQRHNRKLFRLCLSSSARLTKYWCHLWTVIDVRISLSLKFSSPQVSANQLVALDFPPWYRGLITVTVPLIFPRWVPFSCMSKKSRAVRHVVGRVLMLVPNLTSQSKWDCHQHGVMLMAALSSWALKACKSVNSAASLSSSVSSSLGSLQKAQFSFFPEMFVLI